MSGRSTSEAGHLIIITSLLSYPFILLQDATLAYCYGI